MNKSGKKNGVKKMSQNLIKKSIICFSIFFLVSVTSAFAESSTLFDSSSTNHSGFGSASIKITTLFDESRVMLGGEGYWLINDSFYLGGGCWGTPEFKTDQIVSGSDVSLRVWYGGIKMGVVLFPDALVHLSIDVLAGMGNTEYTIVDNDTDPTNDVIRDSSFFILEPTIKLIMNLTEYVQVYAGASIRQVRDVDILGIESDDLCGESVMIGMNFGAF